MDVAHDVYHAFCHGVQHFFHDKRVHQCLMILLLVDVCLVVSELMMDTQGECTAVALRCSESCSASQQATCGIGVAFTHHDDGCFGAVRSSLVKFVGEGSWGFFRVSDDDSWAVRGDSWASPAPGALQ